MEYSEGTRNEKEVWEKQAGGSERLGRPASRGRVAMVRRDDFSLSFYD